MKIQMDGSFAWGLPKAIPKRHRKSFARGKACCIPEYVCLFPVTHWGIPAARRCILSCGCPFLYCALTHSRRREERRGAELDRGVGERWDLTERTSCKSLGQTLSLFLSVSFTLSLSISHTHSSGESVCVCVWMWCLQAAGEWRGFCRGRLCGRNVCNYTTTQTEEKWQCRLNSYSTERRWELHVSFHCIFAINSIV